MHAPSMTDDSLALLEMPTSSSPSRISVSFVDVVDLDDAGALWSDLQVRSRHSYFTSWGWIGCWLSQLPVDLRPSLLIAETELGVVGLGLISRKRIRRGRVITSNALFLHETGNPELDSLTIEHNGILADQDLEEPVHRAILEFLCRECPDWDELYLPGLDVDSPLARAVRKERSDVAFRTMKRSPCYMVDLAKLQNSGTDFCSSLGSSTRAGIRKSIRLYEERGPLTVCAPKDVNEALQFFEELKRLHNTAWQDRGDSGAFSHAWVDGFHRRLIETRFPHGEIQLLQIKAGDQLIGALYNLVHDGHVAFYQSGFQYEENARLKPGLVCHTLAVNYNRVRGAHTYDFLAGDSQYKRSLGEERQSLQWSVLQRKRLKFRFEELLRAARSRMRGLLPAARPAAAP